jgi:ubiquinone/menaquinone biosynthesis C-methylase UbiE
LTEIHRVLKPGGRIYITDFTADGVASRAIDILFKKREKEHVQFYSTQAYRRFFAGVKLEYISAQVIALSVMKVHIGEKHPFPKGSLT